jgi:hypothetical protein
MLKRPKHSKNEVVAPKEVEEYYTLSGYYTFRLFAIFRELTTK